MGVILLELKDFEVLHAGRGGPLTAAIDLKICSGEIHVVRGANGIGKSSLIRSILEGPKATGGLYRGSFFTCAGLQYTSHPQITAPMFALPLRLSDILTWTGDLADAAKKLLEGINLDRSWDSCSGGERQRTLIATLFTKDVFSTVRPTLLLLDEPLNHLDPRSQTEVLLTIQAWVAAGPKRAVLIVTHEDLPAMTVKETTLRQSEKS